MMAGIVAGGRPLVADSVGGKSFVDQLSAYSSSTVNMTVTKPTLTASGDMMLVYIVANSGETISVPAGWTKVSDVVSGSRRLIVANKIAGGSEPASYAFPVSSSSGRRWWFSVYRGVSSVLVGALGAGTNGASSAVAPAITMPADGILVSAHSVLSGGANRTVTVAPSGVIERLAVPDTVYSFYGYDNVTQAAGGTGTKLAQWSGGSASYAQLIGLT